MSGVRNCIKRRRKRKFLNAEDTRQRLEHALKGGQLEKNNGSRKKALDDRLQHWRKLLSATINCMPLSFI
ncbi:hypothetical protein CCR75_005303 [Bremia lactucae]|uniref:Uncharacterized protein n=1 Tax=Bremia lactucae TaxID=4779 RepID=A0A976FQD2_BRELC|nr:hypothetical protein CCR75_005303 [Bremia lactucae]